MSQLKPLTKDETAARESGLDTAARLIGSKRPLSIAQLQALYDALLPEDAGNEAQIAVGLAFGEQICACAPDFEWARISDEYGDETCVAAIGKEIFLAPISMIQKRIQKKEKADLATMRDEAIAMVRQRIAEGLVADR